MTYNPSIPQVNDDPSVSQAQILANFGIWNTDFAVNHLALTSGANQGFHTQISFPLALGGDPNLAAPQASLYPKTSGGNTELFFQNGSSASNVRQLTGLPIVTTRPGATGFGFQTPWGMIFNSGTVPSGIGTVNLQIPFPPGFTLLTALLTQKGTTSFNIGTVVSVVNVGGETQLSYSSSANAYFLVIGK